MLLFEIGTTQLDLKWASHGKSHSCVFDLDDEKYGISAEEDEFDGIPAVEIYFYIFEDGKQSLSLSDLGKNEIKVLSIAWNAVSEKFSSMPVIWFSAKARNDGDDLEKRKSLYRKLTTRISRINGYFHVEGQLGDDFLFVLFKNNSDKEKIYSYLGIK